MIRTILGFAIFWLILIISLIMFIPYGIFMILGMYKTKDSMTDHLVRFWGKLITTLAGAKLKIIGRDRIPDRRDLVFICNHQGMLDIPVLLSGVSHCVGFIAKKQLLYVPIINFWMMAIHCVFLDRKNVHAASRVMAKGVENIKKGYPMAIFPEGTRSRGKGMGQFKKGSLKLALLAEAMIVPVTINGTYEVYERQGKAIGGPVSIEFHEPIDVKLLSEYEIKGLMERIRQTVESGLTEIKN